MPPFTPNPHTDPLEKSLQRLVDQTARLLATNTKLAEDIAKLSESVNELLAENDKLSEDIDTIQTENDVLLTDIEELQAENEELTFQLDQIKATGAPQLKFGLSEELNEHEDEHESDEHDCVNNAHDERLQSLEDSVSSLNQAMNTLINTSLSDIAGSFVVKANG